MARIRSRSCPASGDVAIIGIEPVGNYAVRLTFDDLHDTGIYSWDYLHELGREQDRPLGRLTWRRWRCAE